VKRNNKTKTQSFVKTNLGKRLRIGTNEWGKALVACPQCNQPAVVDATQTIWCRACGYTSAGIAGCA
jgi:ribosomal protein L37AE/L43A